VAIAARGPAAERKTATLQPAVGGASG